MGKGSVIMGTIATLLAVPTVAAGVIAAIPEKREKALDWVAKYSNEYKLKDKEIEDLRAENEAKTAELNAARTNLTRVQNELATANSNLAQARADKSSLQTQLNSANADKARLTAELAESNGDNVELQEQLNVVNARITSLNSQLAENAELIAGLETEVDELTGNVNTLTARVAELEAQLEEAQYDAGYTLTEDNSNFNFGYKDETGHYCVLTKNLVNDEMSPVTILTTMRLKSILNGQVSNCYTDENYMLEIPSMDISTYVMKHKIFHVNYRENLTTNINIVAKDTNGEIFDLQGLNKLNKSTYYVKLTNFDYVTYTNQELSSENVNLHEFYLKSISIEISVELAEYSDEEILIPELGTYMTEDGAKFQFYRDQSGTVWYKIYSNNRWGSEHILDSFNVDNDNYMHLYYGDNQLLWQNSDSFIIEYSNRYPELQGLLFTKQSAIDTLKDTLANGGSITLTEDILLENETLEVTADNVTIDLGGHTITGANIDGAVIKVNAGSELALVGTGAIRGGSGADCRCIEVQGRLHVQDNVTMSVGPDANGQGNSCIFVNADNAFVTIAGGSFETDADWNGFYYVVNIKNNVQNATISIYGGTFKNYDPSLGDDVLGGNFVTPDCFVDVLIDDTGTYYHVIHKEVDLTFLSENKIVKFYNDASFELMAGDVIEIYGKAGTMSDRSAIILRNENNEVIATLELSGSYETGDLSFEYDGETFVMFNPEIHYEFYGHYWDLNCYTEDTFEMRFDYTFKLIKHSSNYNEELDQYEPIVIERTGTFETSFDDMTGQGTITLNFEDGETIVGYWYPDGNFGFELNGDELFFAKQ